MWRLRRSVEDDDDEKEKLEIEIMSQMKSLICKMHCPPLVLPSGRTGRSDKFFVVMLGLFLISGYSVELFLYTCRQLMTRASDFGIEFKLPKIKLIPFKVIFPWYQRDPNCNLLDGDGFVEAPAYDPVLDTPVSMNRAIDCPGLLHILHNAGDGLLDVMPSTFEAIDQVSDICNLLSREHTRGRVIATCFPKGVGAFYAHRLERFHAHMHKKRWGSVLFDIMALLKPLVIAEIYARSGERM